MRVQIVGNLEKSFFKRNGVALFSGFVFELSQAVHS